MQDTLLVQDGNTTPWTVFVSDVKRLDSETEPQFKARMQGTHVPSGHVFVWTTKASLPPPPVNSWAIDWATGNVSIRVPRLDELKATAKERLRMVRGPLLAALDIAWMKAMELGADTKSIVTEKNRLRNITGLVDACTTAAELNAIQC